VPVFEDSIDVAKIGEPEAVGTGRSLEDVAKEFGLPIKGGKPDFVGVSSDSGKEVGSLTWDYSPSTGNLHYAAVLPNSIDIPTTIIEKADEYDDNNVKYEDVARLSFELYKNEGYVGTCVDTLLDVSAMSKWSILNVEDVDAKLLLTRWLRHINSFSSISPSKKVNSASQKTGIRPVGGIDSVAHQALFHLLVTGDWVAIEHWENIDVPGIDGKRNLPTRLRTLNIDNVEFSAAAASAGIDLVYYKVPSQVSDAVKKAETNEQKIIKESVPDWMVKEINAGEDRILLPPTHTIHLRRREVDYSPTGISYVQRFFGPIADKLRLRALDRSTIAGMIQRLTIVMMGHDNPDHPLAYPSPERFSLLRRALTKLKTDMFMVWGGNDLHVLDIGPDGKVLGLDPRYKEVNDDLRRASGLPPILTEGTSAAGGRDMIALINTVSKVENIRANLEKFISEKLRLICVENKMDDIYPVFKFRVTNLRDERLVKSTVVKLYEDGLLPRSLTLDESGYDSDYVISQHMREKESGVDEKIGLPPVSFSMSGDGDRTTNPEPGRPENSPEDTKKREDRAPDGRPTEESMFYANVYDDEFEESDIDDIRSIFSTAREKIVDAARDEDISADKVAIVVVAAFAAFNDFTDDLIGKFISIKYSSLDITWRTKLLAWNQMYVTNFVSQIKNYIYENFTSESFPDRLDVWLSGYQSTRVKQYVEEISAKTSVAVFLEKAQRKGVSIIQRMSAGDEKVCEVCDERDGALMSIDDFWREVPSHPKCRCGGKEVPVNAK